MKRLNEKEAYVIKNRIMADAPLTLQEIGDHLKLSRERVRQIEAKHWKVEKRVQCQSQLKCLIGGSEDAYLRIPMQTAAKMFSRFFTK